VAGDLEGPATRSPRGPGQARQVEVLHFVQGKQAPCAETERGQDAGRDCAGKRKLAGGGG
jgi:hypothetical protein